VSLSALELAVTLTERGFPAAMNSARVSLETKDTLVGRAMLAVGWVMSRIGALEERAREEFSLLLPLLVVCC
jgi:hypothetical protein